MPIGAHVSIAGGIWNAPANAAAEGCACFQLFTRSPQGGSAPELTDDVVQRFRDACAANGQTLWVVHTPYYINLASAEERVRIASARVIRDELDRASHIEAAYVMTHLGSARDVGEDVGRAHTIDGLVRALDGYTGSTKFCIEISAGAGAVIGGTFEEIAEIIHAVEGRLSASTSFRPKRDRGPSNRLGINSAEKSDTACRPEEPPGDEGSHCSVRGILRFAQDDPSGQISRLASPDQIAPRFGRASLARDDEVGIRVCFDTQHAFASGYDLRTPDAVAKTVAAFDRTIGLDRLAMSHVNDSKVEFGERKDRHEHIGQGKIGREGIRAVVQHPAFRDLPLILETETEGRMEDVRLLKEFRDLLGLS